MKNLTAFYYIARLNYVGSPNRASLVPRTVAGWTVAFTERSLRANSSSVPELYSYRVLRFDNFVCAFLTYLFCPMCRYCCIHAHLPCAGKPCVMFWWLLLGYTVQFFRHVVELFWLFDQLRSIVSPTALKALGDAVACTEAVISTAGVRTMERCVREHDAEVQTFKRVSYNRRV